MLHTSAQSYFILLEREPTDVYALNTHGLLLERLKLYNTAAEQFATALELSQGEEKDMISVNLARVLIQIGRYEEAVKLCKQVKNESFNSQCHLALSLFKGARTSAINLNHIQTSKCEESKKYFICSHVSQTVRRIVQYVRSSSTLDGH